MQKISIIKTRMAFVDFHEAFHDKWCLCMEVVLWEPIKLDIPYYLDHWV